MTEPGDQALREALTICYSAAVHDIMRGMARAPSAILAEVTEKSVAATQTGSNLQFSEF